MTGHSGPAVDVFADAFESGCLVEIGGTNALSDDVPVGSARLHF